MGPCWPSFVGNLATRDPGRHGRVSHTCCPATEHQCEYMFSSDLEAISDGFYRSGTFYNGLWG